MSGHDECWSAPERPSEKQSRGRCSPALSRQIKNQIIRSRGHLPALNPCHPKCAEVINDRATERSLVLRLQLWLSPIVNADLWVAAIGIYAEAGCESTCHHGATCHGIRGWEVSASKVSATP
jgi:hypothetical protein